ncbi:hypothetical protein OEZ85_003665 [Tetradesmus obliquus]|uniref:HNH nuclease domain-containing protein n=1 Tax=Tetradesmus obliquus TaxID=3088 RepID=A0ABY8UCA8_TETOB|nr:hypothetical protein OEZ85_003664 [Tetradesmus obliquus]WIA19000.1 hypothetical protein OEZ85_003665 [Tetradesmus obliquus]
MQATLARENMSTTPEAIERKIVAKETEVERVKKQLEDAIGDRDRELLLRQELAALQQQLAALQQQLAALQQKEVLLMQQQAAPAAAAAGDAVGLSKVFEQLEILKEQLQSMECSARELVAGHIYRQQWPKSLLAKVGVTLHDPSNIIIMQSQLEKAFDKWQWIVLPDGPDDYKVHMSETAEDDSDAG